MRHYGLFCVNPDDLIMQNGARWFTDDGTRCIIDSKEAVEAFEFYQDLRLKYNCMPTAAQLASQSSMGGWGAGDLNLFATKYFAMTRAGRYWFIQYGREIEEAKAKGRSPPYNLGVAEPPYFTRKWGRAGARCTGVNRTSRNGSYAVRFLEYLASEPFNRQINRTFDALAPVMKYCTGPRGIADGPPPPEGCEAANDTLWTAFMEFSEESERSPFITPYRVSFHWDEIRQAVDAEAMEPAEALRQLAQRINDEIQENIKRNPGLNELYNKAVTGNRSAAAGGRS
jgi:ABC-type glycerol-3-phosphate transport system substrate-binding protein